MELFFLPFLLSLLLTALFLALLISFFRGSGISGRKEVGREHKPVSRFGGVAFIAVFFIMVFLDTHLTASLPLSGLLFGSLLVLLVGILDDIMPIPWWAQLLFQIMLAGIIFFFGMRAWVITNPFGSPIFLHPGEWVFPSFLVGLLFTVLIMNAINFADGVDGLLGGVSLVAFISIFFVSLRPEVNQPTVAILAAITVGISLAFLFFNFAAAKIVAGTSGAFFIGFVIVVLSLFSGVKIATTLLVLAVPALDALFVVVARLRSGVSPFRGGDGRHLHDRLRRLGWSDRSVAVFYTGVSACAAFAALSLQAFGKFFFLFALAIVFALFLSAVNFWIKRKRFC